MIISYRMICVIAFWMQTAAIQPCSLPPLSFRGSTMTILLTLSIIFAICFVVLFMNRERKKKQG